MTRARSALLLVVGLLLALVGSGLSAPGAVAGATDGRDGASGAEVPTTITVTVSTPAPLTLHLDIAVAAADGSPVYGQVRVSDDAAFPDPLLVSGGSTTFDRAVSSAGPRELTFDFSPAQTTPGTTYLPSGTTASVTVPGRPTTTRLTLSNEGVGVIELDASVSNYGSAEGAPGSMIFRVEGLAPVEIPMGTYVVPGRVEVPNAGAWFATLDLSGLDPKGTYTATATFVPGAEAMVEGSTSSPQTVTLSARKDQSAVQIGLRSPRPRVVEFSAVVYALFPEGASGTLVVQDLDTRKRVLRLRSVALFPETVSRTLRHVSPGVHRYRATFVPDPGVKNLLGDSDVGKVTVRD